MRMHDGTAETWPELPLAAWRDTCDTLHMWTQIVGKVALELKPFLNEWWEVGFHLTGRGLTTGLIPAGGRQFDITFDLLGSMLYIAVSDGQVRALPLRPRSVAHFYRDLMGALHDLGIEVSITTTPSEIPDPVPFDQNEQDAAYDPEYVIRWWRIMAHTDAVLQHYRSGFVGKSSPVLFFWGSFDLAETRFNGKKAPPMKGMPRFYQIAEDQENIAVGFWPGNTNAAGVTYGEPAYYAYMTPAPPSGYQDAHLNPQTASFDTRLGEWLLRYEDVRSSANPSATLLQFFQSAYAAFAEAGGWDRQALERQATTR